MALVSIARKAPPQHEHDSMALIHETITNPTQSSLRLILNSEIFKGWGGIEYYDVTDKERTGS